VIYPSTFRNTCNWKLGGTLSFRNASGMLFKNSDHPVYADIGSNLQNPSERLLQLYHADEGKILLQCDQAGAEALIVAYLCRDGKFRQLFRYGIKPHTFVAMHLFAGIWAQKMKLKPEEFDVMFTSQPIPELKHQPRWKELEKLIKKEFDGRYYFIGKKSCHSFNYDKHWSTFIFDVLKESEGKVVLPPHEGARIYEVYHGLFPEIHEWHSEVRETVRTKRELRNLFDHPRRFFGIFTDDFFRKAYAQIPQSTVGVIANRAFCAMQRYIERERKEWDVLNNKHDSVLVQCPVAEWEECARVLKQTLEVKMISPKDGTEFQMRSELSKGYCWGKHDPEKCPDGMEEFSLSE
jgi:hypothetical protein